MNCNLLEIDPRFGGTYCLHLQGQRLSEVSSLQEAGHLLVVGNLLGLHCDPEDEGSMFLQNVGEFLPDYTVLLLLLLLLLFICLFIYLFDCKWAFT
jgi:hypothetical protein